MRKGGVTLVEVLLACAVALIGIAAVMALAAAVIQAGGRVKEKNVTLAQARVAAVRMRKDREAAQGAKMKNGEWLVTQAGGGRIYWGIWQDARGAFLTRRAEGEANAEAKAVAEGVSGLDYAEGARAMTVALTAGGRRMEEVMQRWGETL